MAGLMSERRWSKKHLLNRAVEYGVIAALALLFVLVMLPSDEDAGDYSIHEPGKAHVKHHESALMATVHHMEGQCGRFHALRSRPNMQLLDGTDKVVLVTGAAGFIGSHTARYCRDLGMKVIAVDDMSGGFKSNIPEGVTFVRGDLKDAQFVDHLFKEYKFDYVYHLAAYAAEGLSHFIRTYNYRNNLVATVSLVNAAVKSGTVKCFVFTSSIAVYGAGQVPFDESTVPIPEDPYGVSKYASELDLRAARDMFGLDFIVVRPHNVYGPGQNMFDKYRNVIGIFLNQLSQGKPLTIFGDGLQTRKFSYVDDVALPLAQMALAPWAYNQVFNVGADTPYTVTKDAWGSPEVEVRHLEARLEVENAESKHTKLQCFFPHLPSPVNLGEGMGRMVKWAKEQGINFAPVEFKSVEVLKNMPPSWVTPSMTEVPAVEHTADDKADLDKQLGV